MPVGDTTGTSSNPSRDTSWDFASRHLRGGIWAAAGCPADRHGACKTEPPRDAIGGQIFLALDSRRVSGFGPSTLMCPIPVTHTHTRSSVVGRDVK